MGDTVKWQPIETAPKDGTKVVLYCPSNDTFIFDAVYRKVAFSNSRSDWHEWDGEYVGAWSKLPDWFKPTHWMIVTPPNGDNE
jgi:hypothetical protein